MLLKELRIEAGMVRDLDGLGQSASLSSSVKPGVPALTERGKSRENHVVHLRIWILSAVTGKYLRLTPRVHDVFI